MEPTSKSATCLASLVVAVGSLIGAATASADGLVLSRDGQSEYVIVVPDRATPVEKTAAAELREHLSKITGAPWPVVAEAASPAGAPRLVVGYGALAKYTGS